MNEYKEIEKPITDIILSVDSSEWYYGQKSNLKNEEKRILIKTYVPAGSMKLDFYTIYVNEHFLWMQSHERDTLKRKKRNFYVDKDLFKSQSFKFD